MEDEQIKITITCDKYHIADELHKLANAVEENDGDIVPYYETYYCVAEFKEL